MAGAASPSADYRADIAKEYARGLATEHSYRPALKTRIEAAEPSIAAVNDPRRVEAGAPDFVVVRDTTHGPVTVGHIETKTVGVDLDAEQDSEQLTRYRAALDNLILTDYVEFRLYRSGVLSKTARLGHPGKGLVTWASGTDAELDALLTQFLAYAPPPIKTAKELAERMAKLTALLAHSVGLVLPTSKPGSMLPQLKQALQETLLPDIQDAAFADMFSQTLAYGLFAARVNHTAITPFRRQDAAREIPKSNPFLRRLFEAVTGVDLDEEPFVSFVDDLAQVLALADMTAVLANFGKTTRQDDPVVHFYETFLAAYDPRLRDVRGVYYTPEPVVTFIVDSVDALLRSKFGLSQGLADRTTTTVLAPNGEGEVEHREVPKVLVLDPACGTGTFPYAVVDLIRDQMRRAKNAGQWAPYVTEQLIPRLFGFELLMAPYAIAHLKLGPQLAGKDLPPAERGDWAAPLGPDDRINVFLTNSLEEAVPKSAVLMGGYISEEANAAAAVKKELPIVVVLGNPPYQGNSANRSWRMVETVRKGRARKGKVPTGKVPTGKVWKREPTFIGKLLSDYYSVDGAPLKEKNPKWLQDDYVKFIRFGQWRIEETGEGILAFITNHSYLDNPTFRGMRQQLMKAFTDIYILDLHGSQAKRERTPSGDVDENVFDILRGVAISLFVRREASEDPAKVWHSQIWGRREDKYTWLSGHDVNSTTWTQLEPTSPDYFFVPINSDVDKEWRTGWTLPEAMPVNSVGIVTSRDDLVFDLDKPALVSKVKAFVDKATSEDSIRLRFFGHSKPGERPAGDTESWSMADARKSVAMDTNWEKKVIPCLYRPFDVRALLYHPAVIERGRVAVMRHMLNCYNIGLVSARSNRSPDPDHFFSTRYPSEAKAGEATTQSYLFPLYLCPVVEQDGQTAAFAETEPSVNFAPAFVESVETRTGLTYGGDPSGFNETTLFDYMYSLFHTSEYRERYAPLLKLGFPRVLVPSDAEWFRDMAKLGAILRTYHLLEFTPAPASLPSFPVPGSNTVATGFPRYLDAGEADPFTGTATPTGRIYINGSDVKAGIKGQYFEGVSDVVWETRIGGYAVVDHWLGVRQGRRLSGSDVDYVARTCAALQAAAEIRTQIDALVDSNGGMAALVA